MSGDSLPTILGIALVAAAAAFALLPLARGARVEALPSDTAAATDRFALYRQVLELEFDYHLGKMSAEDYENLSTELMAQAGTALRVERGSLLELDEEIEREIAAARAAFAAARQASPPNQGSSTDAAPVDGRDGIDARAEEPTKPAGTLS